MGRKVAMLNIHVVATSDTAIQVRADLRVLRVLKETQITAVGLIISSAQDEDTNYSHWASNLARLLRKNHIRVSTCGAELLLCPRPQFMIEQERLAHEARERRIARGQEEPEPEPKERAIEHALACGRHTSGDCETVVAIYGAGEILRGLTERNIAVNREITPGMVIAERRGEIVAY